MGLFGKPNDEKDRKKVKRQVDKLMKQYDKGKIDGGTYAKGIFGIKDSYGKKKKR
jgi:hypothetical protein